MIHSGKLLENSKSFADYKIPTTNQVLANAFEIYFWRTYQPKTIDHKPHTLHPTPYTLHPQPLQDPHHLVQGHPGCFPKP
jgi:hypothetical protein